MIYPAIDNAVKYLKSRGVKIPVDILSSLPKDDLTNENKSDIAKSIKAEMKQSGEYSSVRNEMWAAVYDAVDGYLSSTSYIVSFNNVMAAAVAKAYIEAADIGYEDGGGTLPLDEDTLAWATAELNAQMAYIDSLFQTLKALRKEGDFDAISEAFKHADGYARSLDMLYNGAKMAGAGNKMLTFAGSDGKESCTDCMRLKGQRHRASWWIAHDYVPPSRNFECGGYNCQHILVDDDGSEFTV